MTAKIVLFPRPAIPVDRPKFWQWLPQRVGARHVYRVKRRTPTCRGVPWGDDTVLLPRQWDALEREYEAKYGPIYPRV
jgi:hypothetical protein